MNADERGAGTVLALSLVAVALGVLTWVSIATHIATKQLEAQALADRVALAADESLRGKGEGPPCELAKRISEQNGGQLDRCRIVERKVVRELHIYIDFSFSTKTATLSLQASASAEPVGQ